MAKRVLMIVTSHASMGNTGKATGIWAEEWAVPYYMLLDAGIEVDIVSPLGGSVPFDPASVKAKGENPVYVERFLNDAVAQQKIANTSMTSHVKHTQFDAIFFPGGHGAMWDLPNDNNVADIVATAFATNKVIAAVCHGVAGLVQAKRDDGQSILFGKNVNCFTDEEEAAIGLDQIVPFKLEQRLRELGGQFHCAPNWQTFVIRDEQLITGQNPQSSELVATRVLMALN